jgi:hypothetical protein
MLLFRQAADAEGVNLGLLERISDYLQLARRNPELRFRRRIRKSEDDGLGRQDEALRRKIGAPERRWRLKSKDGVSGSKMAAREAKKAAGSQDGRPERRWPPGQLKNGPGNQKAAWKPKNRSGKLRSHPDGEKQGRGGKTPHLIWA